MNRAVVHFVLIAVAVAASKNGVNARVPAQPESFQSAFAACNVNYAVSQARQFVIGSGSAPVLQRCLGREWSRATFRVQTYRYALAKVLLQRDFAAGLPLEITEITLSPAQTLWPLKGRDADAERRRFIVAECVIRKEPTKSFALVGVDAGEESAEPVMAQLAATLVVCSAGSQVRYPSGFEMHESIVTRMYQLAYAARKPANA